MGLLAGPVTGFVTWLVTRPEAGLGVGLKVGLAAALVAWLGAGIVDGMSRPGTGDASPLSPLDSWRSDRAFGLVTGLVVLLWAGLGAALAVWLSGPVSSLVNGLVTALVAGLLIGLVYPQSWSSSLAFAQLAASDRTPVRLMRFLEDARSRSVLRTVGPVYQFRHARLQDRLATQETATGGKAP